MTKREMKKWAVKKWQWIVENWDYDGDSFYNHDALLKAITKLSEFEANCSFCEEYDNGNCTNEKGESCPLGGKDRGDCCEEFQKWDSHRMRDNIRSAKYWAQKMLDKIKEV